METIIDVKEPSNPKILKQIFLDNELSHTHKVRVAGNIMITNVEQAQRHLLRRGEKLRFNSRTNFITRPSSARQGNC